MKYKIINKTPRNMRCGIGLCPAIYEITPKDMRCIAAACNKIYNNEEKPEYLIIVNQYNPKNLPKDFGLEGKVG